jgi:5-methylcytosine-specific restriction endonuclease McrA
VHEWRLRTDPGYLREQVFRRDQGVCSVCRVNTVEAHLQLRRARGERRQERLAKWGLRSVNRKSLWDADHILPVAEGGGECDLQNIRTLCLICHRRVTRELIERLRRAKQEVTGG